jgi:hypothetical protein
MLNSQTLVDISSEKQKMGQRDLDRKRVRKIQEEVVRDGNPHITSRMNYRDVIVTCVCLIIVQNDVSSPRVSDRDEETEIEVNGVDILA